MKKWPLVSALILLTINKKCLTVMWDISRSKNQILHPKDRSSRIGEWSAPKKFVSVQLPVFRLFTFFSDFLNSTGGTIDSVRFLNKFYFDPKRPLLDISHFLFSKKHKRERKKTIIFIFYRFFKSMTSAKMILSLRIKTTKLLKKEKDFLANLR